MIRFAFGEFGLPASHVELVVLAGSEIVLEIVPLEVFEIQISYSNTNLLVSLCSTATAKDYAKEGRWQA